MTTKKGEPRESVRWFARRMEEALERQDPHRGKAGWRKEPDSYLIGRLLEEVMELMQASSAVRVPNVHLKVQKEAADVANFAMMIADNARRG